MMRRRGAALAAKLAVVAAALSAETGLAMADTVVLAAAQEAGATLWTQDLGFGGTEEIEYREENEALHGLRPTRP